MVTWSDIASFIVSCVSLVATIAVSFIILHLDRKHEKHKEAEQEKIRLMNLEHEADAFLLKNNEEIQFLPLCVIANNLNPTKQHRREIYNNFNLCSDELKSIILKKYNIDIKSIPSNDWFGLCVSKFVKEIERQDLGFNLYYEGAKYVRYCFRHYAKEELPEKINQIEFTRYKIEN